MENALYKYIFYFYLLFICWQASFNVFNGKASVGSDKGRIKKGRVVFC